MTALFSAFKGWTPVRCPIGQRIANEQACGLISPGVAVRALGLLDIAFPLCHPALSVISGCAILTWNNQDSRLQVFIYPEKTEWYIKNKNDFKTGLMLSHNFKPRTLLSELRNLFAKQ
jgi:hypothetical protein